MLKKRLKLISKICQPDKLSVMFLIIKKREKPKIVRHNTVMKKILNNRFALITIAHVFFFLLLGLGVFSQSSILNYKVTQGRDEIGWLKLQKNDSGSTTFITFDSQAKKRMILMFNVVERQAAVYRNGILIQSYVYRKVNNDVKVNKYTIKNGNFYQVTNTGSKEQVMIDGIEYNMLNMYFKEPENIKQVYSDNYQQLLNIESLGNHSYKVKLPGGDVNYYYYTDGACIKIKAEHTLFSVEFILVK